MQSVIIEYRDETIEFLPESKNNVMVNATQMAKIFDKRVDVFLKSDHAKAFIEVLEFTPFGGNSSPLKRDEILQTKGQNGTWMHRVLALKFAAWLDPAFELWVYTQIDNLLNEHYRKHRDAVSERMQLMVKIKAKREKLAAESLEFRELTLLENRAKVLKNEGVSALREQTSQIMMTFLTEED